MEVLPSSGSVYSGSNSVEFIFYRRRILWRTKEIWLSRYSLHDCGVGTLRFQWLRRLYCDLVEVWERYRTAKHKPKSSTTWKAKKGFIWIQSSFSGWKNVEIVHLYQFVASTKNLEELCGIGLLASFFMALGFSAYEVGLAFLDLADSLHGSMASKTLFVREIFVPSIVQKSCVAACFPRLHHWHQGQWCCWLPTPSCKKKSWENQARPETESKWSWS